MTDFSNNPTAAIVLLLMIALISLAVLWVLHIVSKRRLVEKHALEDIMSGKMTVNEARRVLGYPELPNPLDQTANDQNAVKYHHPAA